MRLRPAGWPLCLFIAGCLGCGARPLEAPAPTGRARPPAVGALPAAGLSLWVNPTALDAGLADLDARLGRRLDALGPLGTAWRRARQGLLDALVDLGEVQGPVEGVWQSWGVAPEEVIRIDIAAADDAGLARALLARLQGRPAAGDGPPVWQARARLGVRDTERLLRRLTALADRLGWLPDGPWAEALAKPAGWRGWFRDPDAGALVVLRVLGSDAVVDLVIPSDAKGPVGASLARVQVGRASGEAAALPGAVRWVVRPAGVAALEAAVDGALGLALPSVEAQTAAGEVVSACVSGWAALAALVPEVILDLDLTQGAVLTGAVTLSAAGRAGWAAALRPLPLAEAPWPASYQHGWAPAQFPSGDWAALSQCRLAHPAVIAPALLGVLPGVGVPDPAWLPAPPSGYGAGEPQGMAAALLGVQGEGAPGAPHLAGLLVGPRWGAPPFGPDALQVGAPGARRWVLGGGGVAVSAAEAHLGSTPVVAYGMGPDAALRMVSALGSGAEVPGDRRFLAARLDPLAAATALVEAGVGGPEVNALRAVGTRLGVATLSGIMTEAGPRFRLGWGELDHPPGGK